MKMLRILTILLLLFNGVGALYGGWSLMLDSSGAGLGMSTSILGNSPFRTFFIPGLVLFVFNGILSFITIGSVLSKSRNYPFHVLAQGLVLCGWIAIQIMMLQFLFFLHFVMGGTGILLIVLAVMLFIEKRKLKKNISSVETAGNFSKHASQS